jgi:hypothetical protein
MLVRRRLELDPRYRNRRTFARERDPRLYRLFSDIELGKRTSYKPASLAAIERAYELGPGAIGRFLSGGLESPGTGPSEPAVASPAQAPRIIRVLATIGGNTAAEIAEMTVLTDKVKAVVAAARAFQPCGQLDGRKLFPRDGPQDQRLARAWNVLNAMGFDDELHASIAAWNVVSMEPRAAGTDECSLAPAATRLGPKRSCSAGQPAGQRSWLPILGQGPAAATRTARRAGGRRAGRAARRAGHGRRRSGRAAVRSGRRR